VPEIKNNIRLHIGVQGHFKCKYVTVKIKFLNVVLNVISGSKNIKINTK